MPPYGFYTRLLFSNSGLSPVYQQQLRLLLREIPVVRRALLPALREYSPATPIRLADLPTLRSFREIIGAIEGLPAPSASYFDGVFVKQQDYNFQASCRLLSKSGVRPLSLEETVNQLLRSTPKLATGSNNTLDKAIDNAEAFRTTLDLPELLLAPYLAMDATWWPSAQSPILGLVSKNIAVEAALLPIQGLVNEAALVNSSLPLALDTCHSYASLPRAVALNLFSPRQAAYVRSAFLAPLGRVEAMQALLLVKNNFLGKASIIRPGFDPLEELATAQAEMLLNSGNYDLLTTDLILKGSSHTLKSISQALKKQMEEKGNTYADLIDEHYSSRPGTVTYSRNSDGSLEKDVTTRSGEAYSTEAWMKQYETSLDLQKAAQLEVLKSRAAQLTELIEITPPTPELQRLATSIKEVQQQIATADTYEAIVEAKPQMADITVTLNKTIQITEQAMSVAQKQNIESLRETIELQEKTIQETNESLEKLEEGDFEPEETITE
jgi:hypothetical protein